MKKNGILNSEISGVISKMGHYDSIAVADCGLPIPDGVKRIDLALAFQKPGFLETVDVLLQDFQFEYVLAAAEMKENHVLLNAVEARVGKKRIRFVSHEELKKETRSCKAVIRTGEIIPYANIILVSGVIF